MYEYMNPGFIFLTGLLLFLLLMTILVMKGKSLEKGVAFKHPYIIYFFALVSVVIVYWDGVSTKEKVLSNISIFNGDSELRCSTIGKSYLVSKPKGWYLLDKRSLTDGNLILSIEMCKEEK